MTRGGRLTSSPPWQRGEIPMQIFKRAKVQYKIALLPALAILAVVVLGGVTDYGFSALRKSTSQVYQNFIISNDITDSYQKIITIHQNGFRVIAWTVSGYGQDKIDHLIKETDAGLTGMIAYAQKKAGDPAFQADRLTYQNIADNLQKYRKFLNNMFDVLTADYSAASMYMGSIDDSYQKIIHEMQKLDKKSFAESKNSYESSDQDYQRVKRNFLIIALITCVAIVFLAFFNIKGIIKPINYVVEGLSIAAQQVAATSGQISDSSQKLARGAGEQASSLEETTSALTEASAMVRTNADHSAAAASLTSEAANVVTAAKESMTELTGSMQEISASSDEISKIIRTIDEIAFQTNLLALNAAVEAARAGEAGAGFAVVADEVRNLAKRAADASQNTSVLIEGTIQKIEVGSKIVAAATEAFHKVADNAKKIDALVGEIAAGSQEQALTIDHINRAVNDMDRVVQENAAQAEQTASFSEEMNGQAEQMGSLVMELTFLVRGANGQVKGGRGSIEDQATDLLPGHVEYEMAKSSGKQMDG